MKKKKKKKMSGRKGETQFGSRESWGGFRKRPGGWLLAGGDRRGIIGAESIVERRGHVLHAKLFPSSDIITWSLLWLVDVYVCEGCISIVWVGCVFAVRPNNLSISAVPLSSSRAGRTRWVKSVSYAYIYKSRNRHVVFSVVFPISPLFPFF